jgi:hypothetical protein
LPHRSSIATVFGKLTRRAGSWSAINTDELCSRYLQMSRRRAAPREGLRSDVTPSRSLIRRNDV